MCCYTIHLKTKKYNTRFSVQPKIQARSIEKQGLTRASKWIIRFGYGLI